MESAIEERSSGGCVNEMTFAKKEIFKMELLFRDIAIVAMDENKPLLTSACVGITGEKLYLRD